MKTLFIEARYDKKIRLDKRISDKIPDKIGLVATVQFADQLKDIKKFLIKNNKKIFIAKAKQKYPGQILGCDVRAAEKIKNKVDAFLYIGSGRFHPIGVHIKTKKPVFIFNPLSNNFSKLDKKDIERYEKRKKGKLLKFLTSSKIGFLVSLKPGQNRLKQVLEFKDFIENKDKKIKNILKNKKIKKYFKNKKTYIFASETLDISQLDNFPFIECWINTACPRIEEDKSNIINIEDISELSG